MTVNYDGRFETLADLLKVQEGSDDWSLVRRAYDIAKEKHANQKRLSGEPFFIHPFRPHVSRQRSAWTANRSRRHCCTTQLRTPI